MARLVEPSLNSLSNFNEIHSIDDVPRTPAFVLDSPTPLWL